HHLLMATNEAVNNVMKHSEATACSLAFHVESGMLSIILSDNGQGFDLENIPTNRNGLINLQKRMASIEGSVILRSNLRKGTTIAFRIPLPSRWRKLGDRFRLFRPIKTTIKPSSCH